MACHLVASTHHSRISARLLSLAEDHARSLGLREIRLYTNEAMTENLAYYRRHGYAETHRGRARRIPQGVLPQTPHLTTLAAGRRP